MADGCGQNIQGEGYQHAVFFEAEHLKKKEKKKIQNFFRIKRNGGGECGDVEEVGEKTYRIAFLEKRVQERVLERRDHVIPLPGGELCVSVRDRRSPDSTDPHQPPQLPSDDQQTPSSSKELEKVFIMDQYLLQYLRDCPKANQALNKQLIALKSSVQLSPETEQAVVKFEASGAGPVARPTLLEWVLQVEQIFDNVKNVYRPHYEMDSAGVKILKLNIAVLVTEDVKVYLEEDDFAVVVGRNVNEKLKMLEEKNQTRKDCPVSERQYYLVKEELEKELRVLSPGVKISQNGPNNLILEGPNQEVQLGLTKLQELLKDIKEKRFQLLNTLLDFLVSSGSVSRFQARFERSLCCPVALEIGSDLILSSLSTDALEEAATMVFKELCWFTEPLEEPLGQPPALDWLKEALRKVQGEANVTGSRVVVKYQQGSCGDPRTRVQLVGYSEEVGRLKKVIVDYQAEVHESMPLPLLEMVDSFDKVKDLMGLNLNPGVRLTLSHSPVPCVKLSGPRCLVQKVLEDFKTILDCMTWKKQERRSRLEAAIRRAGIAASSTRGSSPDQAPTSSPLSHADLEVVLGSLEKQQVDGLVAPMVNTQLQSCVLGICLNSLSSEFLTNFDRAAAGRCLVPGEVLEVKLSSSLKSSTVFFIECLPWDAEEGQSEKALRSGLALVLDMCRQQGLSSVALPVIGPGRALKFPSCEAARIVTEEIIKLGWSGSTGLISTIRIVIKPGYPDSDENFQHVYTGLTSKIVNWRGKAVFSSLTSDLDTITLEVAGVRVQLVFGDITKETTDVVVNSTNFVDLQSGVCKDILTVAGPKVETELRSAHVNRGGLYETKHGRFPCKSILHVWGQSNTTVIQGLVSDIMKTCDQKGYQSVAIPAISAGKAGLDHKLVADSILQGVKATASSTPLHHLKLVRLVLIKMDVFLAFKGSAEKLFPSGFLKTALLSLSSNSPRSLQPNPPSSTDPDLSSLLPTSSSPDSPSEVLVLGLCDEDVSKAGAEIKRLYQDQCSQHSFTREDLARLTQAELIELSRQVSSLNLTMKLQGGGQGQSTQGGFTLSGPKDGVNKAVQKVQGYIHSCLRQKMRQKEQEEAYSRVTWCMMGTSGDWERVPKEANLQLEKQEVQGGVVDGLGVNWVVDLRKMEATAQSSGRVTKLKRLENFENFLLPLEWDSMALGESLKLVELPTSSLEFHRVTEDFRRSASNKTVLKIERVQNVHLRKAYEVKKKQMEDKNRLCGGAGEKLLYHGTTPEGSQSILETGFNRSFAGQNATSFGKGTYFAVNASRSANPTYSRPDQDGNQLMFVARVLTGQYTQGKANMIIPPPRSPQLPNDRYDSLVDDIQNPTMFIVFHDDQAYPEYLITFKQGCSL
ncbi:protein mono-ADP-ribosyltransferase PARP14-like isoform X2 [Hypomesus transpacificus]|uniref:protein mono-ADP-ribosyltransferase PARP14-like isoform X2 n=1 Tax=Hypomesus transpacificus TaxID=137520 RepID=UPI001F082E87|nr:protein mono-ADP-ribosyltransferase PARP14-like isoform X2 [Hypomesus transpacificus]